MRFSFITFITTICITNADLGRINSKRQLSPDDVGAFHTDAFEKLADMYAVKKPSSRIEMLKDMSNVVASYCVEGDYECTANAYKSALKEFHLAEQEPRTEVTYPEDFNSELLASINEMSDATANFVNGDVNEYLDVMLSLKEKVEDMENVNEAYKSATLYGISIATESSKLWLATYSDADHPLYGVHDESFFSKEDGNNRRLQFDPIAIVTADVTAGIQAAIDAFLDNPLLFVGTPQFLALPAIFAALPASLAVLSGDEDDDDNSTRVRI